MDNLKVCDGEYQSFIDNLSIQSLAAEEKLSYLIEQLQIACTDGIGEGAFHNNLQYFIDQLTKMSGQLNLVSEEMIKNATLFLHEIEEADDIVYEGGR